MDVKMKRERKREREREIAQVIVKCNEMLSIHMSQTDSQLKSGGLV